MLIRAVKTVSAGDIPDSDLVVRATAGDRDAFGEIVARYQSLVCSLTYSATGNVAVSEDLAQETFLAAWQDLPSLRDAAKLRRWLCGVARNTIATARRTRSRTWLPLGHGPEELEQLPAPGPSPSVEAERGEESALVWRALAALPPQYREPLVLYYREEASIEFVAQTLELSEEAVRQRLSRGRKLLQEEVALVVESALSRTKPGAGFTQNVLAALPIGAGAGMAGAKAAGMTLGKIALSGGGLGTIGGLLGGLIGWWVPAELQIRLAESEAERAFMRRVKWCTLAYGLIYSVVLFTLVFGFARWRVAHPHGYVAALLTINAAFVIILLIALFAWIEPHRRKLLGAPPQSPAPALPWIFGAHSYRSKLRFFGLPLVAVEMRGRNATIRPAIGWIAFGDVAIGGLVGVGGIAVAPVAVAGLAVGGIAIGGAGIGGLAFGGAAAGWTAVGGAAFGWLLALGGFAMAREYACGGDAMATHANDAAAQAFAHLGWFQAHAVPLIVLAIVVAIFGAATDIWLIRQAFKLRKRV